MPIKKKTNKKKTKAPSTSAFLFNVTRKKTLSAKGKVLRGLATGLGAMFKGLPGSLVLVWWNEDIIAITNWFVPCDLDIVWLNNDGVIVDVHERFPKGAFRTVNKTKARYVVELEAGTVAKTGTRVGDTIHCSEIAFR